MRVWSSPAGDWRILERAVEELGAGVAAEGHDVTLDDSAEALLHLVETKYGTPTILINNAGTHVKKNSRRTYTRRVWQHPRDPRGGAFAMTQAAVPRMKAAGGGSVIFIASMSSLIGMPNIVAYSAAKAAYLGMVRSLASELGPSNVRVNAIAPGWIETPMLHQALAGDPERQRKILSRTPQQRFGRPEDIGWCAAYLCSPAASFVNGVVLPVDGGASIGF